MPTSLSSLDLLRCFLDAARLGSFRKAAKLHAVTPSAFGQRIKQLEDQVGAPLFIRTTRTVQLAEAGTRMRPFAERCVADADECLRAAQGSSASVPVDVVLGTRHELGISWIVPTFDSLSDSWPGLNLHLYFGSGPDLLAQIRAVQIDCAVTSSRFHDAKLDALRLHREDYVLCGAPSLLRAMPLTQPQHAARHRLFDISEDLPLFRYFRDAPAAPELVFRSITRLGSIDPIRTFVLRGAGVAVLPRYLVADDLKHRRLRALLPSVTPQHDFFRLVFRSNDPRRPIFEAIARCLLQSPLR